MKYNFYYISKNLKKLSDIVQGFMQVVDHKVGGDSGNMLSSTTNAIIFKTNKDLDMVLEDWKKRKTAICIELGKLETIEHADRYKDEGDPEEMVLRIRGESKWDQFLSNHDINSCEGCEECEHRVKEWGEE
jgi:hypothetical protein